MPHYPFDNDRQSVISASMAQVEDIWWLHKASLEIAQATVSAYFVWDPEEQPGHKDQPLAFVIVRLTEAFREQHKTQWARLPKEGLVELQRIRNALAWYQVRSTGFCLHSVGRNSDIKTGMRFARTWNLLGRRMPSFEEFWMVVQSVPRLPRHPRPPESYMVVNAGDRGQLLPQDGEQ
jgi:hypothetical protein